MYFPFLFRNKLFLNRYILLACIKQNNPINVGVAVYFKICNILSLHYNDKGDFIIQTRPYNGYYVVKRLLTENICISGDLKAMLTSLFLASRALNGH